MSAKSDCIDAAIVPVNMRETWLTATGVALTLPIDACQVASTIANISVAKSGQVNELLLPEEKYIGHITSTIPYLPIH